MKLAQIGALTATLLAFPSRAEAPPDLLATVTSTHVLGSIRSAETLVRKLSSSTSGVKFTAMASLLLGMDPAMAEAFEGPVDLAVLAGKDGDTVGGGAISIPWKKPDSLPGIGSALFDGSRPVPLSASLALQQLAAPTMFGPTAACTLHPSPAPPGYRLVCASTAEALASLGAYLATEVAMEARKTDVTVRVPVSRLLDVAERSGALAQPDGNAAALRAGDEAKALGRDISNVALGLGWDAKALGISFDYEFQRVSATTSKLLLSAADHGRSLPDLFQRLPADTLFFGTLGGFDPGLSRAAMQRGVDLATEDVPAAGQMGVALLRPLIDALASNGFAASFAGGVDAKRQLAAIAAFGQRRSDLAREKAAHTLQPWVVVELDGLQNAGPLVGSLLAVSELGTPYAGTKGSKFPSGTLAWTFSDGSTLAALPTKASMVLVFGASAALVEDRLKVVATTGGAGHLKLDSAVAEAFEGAPAMVFVGTEKLSELGALGAEGDALTETSAALKRLVKMTEVGQFPMTVSIKGASSASAWLGSVRVEAQCPMKALQAIVKGAKQQSASGPQLDL